MHPPGPAADALTGTSGPLDAFGGLVDDEPVTTVAPAHPKRFWYELAIILWLYFVYDIINNLSPVSRARALGHAEDILDLERTLRLDIEKPINEWLVHHDVLGSVLANFYNLAHIWVTLALIVFLWVKRRPQYADLRNSLVLFNLIGFAVFWVYPVAPPRMLDGFIDVVEQTGAISSFHSGALAEAANQYAAMPSLHIAWAIWCVVVVRRTLAGRGWRAAIWAHMTVTVVSVVSTANHFVLDIFAGVLTAVVGFAVAELWAQRWRPALRRRRTVRAIRRTA